MTRLYCFRRVPIPVLFLSFLAVSFAEAAPALCPNGGTALYKDKGFDKIRSNLAGKFCLGSDFNQFTGVLDGKSCSDLSKPETCKTHTIKNLTISSLSSSSGFVTYGLFGLVRSGTIENVGLLNVNIAVTYTGASQVAVGGLVGWLMDGPAINNVINNSYITGKIDVQTTPGFVGRTVGLVGGLVGLVGGAGAGSNLIQHSFSTAAVSAPTNSLVGGLVGWSCCSTLSQIKRSYATGLVTSSLGDAPAGGLVGENDGNIEQSYATGPVIAESATGVGGLIGSNYRNGSISQSYATGLVDLLHNCHIVLSSLL